MKRLLLAVLFVPFCLGADPVTGGKDQPGHASDKDHVVVRPEKIVWQPAPPSLPPGAQLAVLVGDPGKPGAAFTIRAKMPDGYKVPPHWHPHDENVTVLQGMLLIGRGDKLEPAKAEELPVGSYMRMPKNMRHFALARGETILQVHGIGPFEIHYVNPADDPRKKADSPK